MQDDYWHKQTGDKPLFPDLLWSRPENRRQAGKLLIVGGNAHGFEAAGTAYSEAVKAGIGTARVLLPDSLQSLLAKQRIQLDARQGKDKQRSEPYRQYGERAAKALTQPRASSGRSVTGSAGGQADMLDVLYAPSTPSGSFSRQALGELLGAAGWADGVLLAGDFGRNSETAVLLEQFAAKYPGKLALTKDAVDYFTKSPGSLLARPDMLLVLSFAQLQKLASSAHFATPFTFEMDLLRLVDALHEFTKSHPSIIVVKHLEHIFVAANRQVSSTKLAKDIEIWRVRAAAETAVWWLQNPNKSFEAITTALTSVSA